MNINYAYFCPSYSKFANIQNVEYGMEGILKASLLLEEVGFDSILTATDSAAYDPWILSSYILGNTKKLKTIIAVRTSTLEPVYTSRMISTLTQLFQDRVHLNIVSMSSKVEMEKENVHLNHDDRYNRTYEFLDIMRNLLEGNTPYSFNGKHFQTKNSTLFPEVSGESPLTYVAGSSTEAQKVGAAYGDVYIFWGDKVERVKENIHNFNNLARSRKVEIGLRVNILIRKDKAQAINVLEKKLKDLKHDPKLILPLMQHSNDSIGYKRMISLSSESNLHDQALYTGAIGNKIGNVPFIIGSPEDVRSTLKRYVDLGVSRFILSSIDNNEEIHRIGEEVLGYQL